MTPQHAASLLWRDEYYGGMTTHVTSFSLQVSNRDTSWAGLQSLVEKQVTRRAVWRDGFRVSYLAAQLTASLRAAAEELVR